MDKKITLFLPFISIVLIAISFFVPLLQLPLLLLSSAAIAVMIATKDKKRYILIITSIVSIALIFWLSLDITYTMLVSVFGILGGACIGLCFTNKRSFKDSIIRTSSVLLVACIATIFAFTYVTTKSFDVTSAFKPFISEIKNTLNDELKDFTELYPEYAKNFDLAEIMERSLNTLIRFAPAMITIFLTLYAVLLFWIVKALCVSTFKIFDAESTDKFSDMHIGKTILVIYVISALISIAGFSDFTDILASNIYIVLDAVFAYSGISMISYLFTLKKMSTTARRLLTVGIVVLSIFIFSNLSLLSIFGIVFDTLMNLREKIRRQGE